MGRFTPPSTETQQKVLAIVPKVTASFSIIGSLYIVQDVCRMMLQQKKRSSGVRRINAIVTGSRHNTNRNSNTVNAGNNNNAGSNNAGSNNAGNNIAITYHRILLSMSVMDFMFAVKSFVSTWPMPSNTRFVWGAKGTTTTCAVAGFLGHGSSLTSAMYNLSLAVYFFCTIVLQWKEDYMHKQLFWLEPLLHLIPYATGWATAIVGLPLDIYNPIGWTCWIGSFPPGCGPDTYPCQRGGGGGDAIDVYRWAFFHAELWFIFAMAGLTLLLIYLTVRKREAAMDQYTFRLRAAETRIQNRRKLAKRVATQAFLYQFFFFMTWVFPMAQFVVSYKTGYLYFPLLCLTVIFTPLQGFFDAIIYLRPRYLKYAEERRRRINNAAASASAAARTLPAAPWRRALAQAISLQTDVVQGEVYFDPNDGDTLASVSEGGGSGVVPPESSSDEDASQEDAFDEPS